MSDPHDPVLAEYLEAALEASAAALVELQLVRSLAGDDERLVSATTRAIAALRSAISDLREAEPGSANPVARGFVLERDPETRFAGPSQEATEHLQRSRRLIERARMSLPSARPRGERGLPSSRFLFPDTPGPLGRS